MPRIVARSSARIFQRLVLETCLRKADGVTIVDQPIAIGGDKVRHGTALPHVAVQPEAAFHREDHP